MTHQIQISRYRAGETSSNEVAALLAASVGNPSEAMLNDLIESCLQGEYPAMWVGSYLDAPVGVMRLDSGHPTKCAITHIAVRADMRGQGIGRKFITFISDDLQFKRVMAETDEDALGFYEVCGFDIESISENKFGVKRYRCVKVI